MTATNNITVTLGVSTMALNRALPRTRTTPERSIFTQDRARVRDDDLAARRSAGFTCPWAMISPSSSPTTWFRPQRGNADNTASRLGSKIPHIHHGGQSKSTVIGQGTRTPSKIRPGTTPQPAAHRTTGRLMPVAQWLAMREQGEGD
jgi:hypothetical protein